MGYWIYLRPVESNVEGEIILSRNYVWEAKRSFSGTRQLCPTHFLDGSCPGNSKCIHCIRRFQNEGYPTPCSLIDIWGIDDDCHRRSGADVAHRAGKALNILKKLGIYPTSVLYAPCHPNKSSLHWISVADDIYEFRKLGQKYPDHYFMRSDEVDEVIPPEQYSDSEYSSELESDTDD